jgi:4-amino-4-deoxy-L-arabinose transferase-like glycosyltransferase
VNGRTLLPLALLLAVVVRAPFWIEALRTPVDGDTAIIGLMARHPGRGTTMWGQPYGSPLEAWLAAPLVAAMGARPDPLRLLYFLLGLGLVPLAYALGGALDRRAAMPAAMLMACPPPYLLLLSSLPPPMYPLALVLTGAALLLALRAAARLPSNEPVWRTLAGWGVWSS